MMNKESIEFNSIRNVALRYALQLERGLDERVAVLQLLMSDVV